MITVALWALLNTSAQSPPRKHSDAWYRSQLPVTLKVAQNVEVNPPTASPERHLRGTLVTSGDVKAFTIKKGETFQMTKLLGEGECRIRYLNKDYDLDSCPWLEGFTDRETDIYQPVATNRTKGRGQPPKSTEDHRSGTLRGGAGTRSGGSNTPVRPVERVLNAVTRKNSSSSNA